MLMLAFGVGTLPMLLAMGGFAEKLQRFTRHKWTRYIAGILLIAFGAMILTKALSGGHMAGQQQGLSQSLWCCVEQQPGQQPIQRPI